MKKMEMRIGKVYVVCFHTTLNSRLGGVSGQLEVQDRQKKGDKDGYIIIMITKRQRIDCECGLFIVVETTWIT